jgi:hypothetical protein
MTGRNLDNEMSGYSLGMTLVKRVAVTLAAMDVQKLAKRTEFLQAFLVWPGNFCSKNCDGQCDCWQKRA